MDRQSTTASRKSRERLSIVTKDKVFLLLVHKCGTQLLFNNTETLCI